MSVIELERRRRDSTNAMRFQKAITIAELRIDRWGGGEKERERLGSLDGWVGGWVGGSGFPI